MTKLTPKIRRKILQQLLRQEERQKSEPRSYNLDRKTKRRDISLAPAPKKELLKVALITTICLVIILGAFWLDIETDFLTQQAQKLTQILHI